MTGIAFSYHKRQAGRIEQANPCTSVDHSSSTPATCAFYIKHSMLSLYLPRLMSNWPEAFCTARKWKCQDKGSSGASTRGTRQAICSNYFRNSHTYAWAVWSPIDKWSRKPSLDSLQPDNFFMVSRYLESKRCLLESTSRNINSEAGTLSYKRVYASSLSRVVVDSPVRKPGEIVIELF